MQPLSIPFSPILWPQSAILRPGHTLPLSSRNWQMKACIPSFLPSITSWEKTIEWVAYSTQKNYYQLNLIECTKTTLMHFDSFQQSGLGLHTLFPWRKIEQSYYTFVAPPIQYFWADSQGVLMMNSWVFGSYVVTVSIPRTWHRKPSIKLQPRYKLPSRLCAA